MKRANLGKSLLVMTFIGALAGSSTAWGQVSFTRYRAMGDSLSHGTQGGLIVDYRTQPRAWPALLASKMGTSFPLPLLDKTTLVAGMRRQDYPSYQSCANLACNGADTGDTINDACESIPWYQFGYTWDFENAVLQPRVGHTQVSAAVADNATFVTFFLGGNEFLQCILQTGTIFEFAGIVGIDEVQPLGAKQPTSQYDFRQRYETAIHQLYAPGRGIAVGTFPKLNNIAAVMDKDEITAIVGANPMPDDCFTNEIIMAAIYRGWLPEWNVDMLADGQNYYTPAELQVINDAVTGYNATIREIAADPNHPCAVADFEQMVQDVSEGLIHVNGWRITDQYTINTVGRPWASMFSSDGVHPSDIGHALVAYSFIDAINSFYGTSIPQFTEAELTAILNNDRFADNDGDGRIEGLSAEAFYYCVNWFLGDTYTGDSGETPRSAKMLTLEITNPTMGRVTTTPEGPEHFTGSTVTLYALANIEGGKIFSHWEGDVPGGYSEENPLTVTMDSDKTVRAVFKCGNSVAAPLLMTILMLGTLALHRFRRR
ncbi:MAG: hypothetical protein JXQ73_21475 [Phycisphaerae bacterium]|nr:hypothetical protein [Phycisphaerae bacterium]